MKKPTKDQLIEASNHLHYEVGMLQGVVSGLSSGITVGSLLHNSLIESFVVHARNLIYFLYPDGPKSNEVLAEHYFEDPKTWINARPPISELLKKANRRADREVAHLTYDRIKVIPEQKGWDFPGIAKDLIVAFNEFLRMVPRDLLGSRWANVKRQESSENA